MLAVQLLCISESKVTLDGGSGAMGAREIDLRYQSGPKVAVDTSLGLQLPRILRPM